MSESRSIWLVRVGLIAFAILTIAGFVLLRRGGASEVRWGFPGFQALVGGSFAIMGAILAARRPENRVGWVLLTVGILNGVQFVVDEYVAAGTVQPGSLPSVSAVAWVAAWIWIAVLALIAYIGVIFPTGKALSARWSWAGWLLAGGAVVMIARVATAPGPFPFLGSVENPLGISWMPRLDRNQTDLYLLILPGFLAALGAIVWRFLRSMGEERLQMKWFAYAAVVAGLASIPGFTPNPQGQALFVVAGTMLPVAIGIAVTRYRLYDIDVIIGGTIVYGSLSAILAGVYTASIVLSQRLFVSVTGEKSDAAIVLTTLIVVSLFTPLKTRLQAIVDRRFHPGEVAPALDPAMQAEIERTVRRVLREG